MRTTWLERNMGADMSDIAVVFYKIVKHHSHCAICGSTNTQFHHVCPKEKLSEVFRVASSGDLSAVIQELNKCVPLCDPHHRGVHKGNIPGWLEGRYDNGGLSHAFAAAQYRPYVRWFGQKYPHVIKRFYADYIEREHDAIWPVMGEIGVPPPRNRSIILVQAVQRIAG